MKQLIKAIKSKCDEYYNKVVDIRREIHKYPELSFCEKNTAEIIKLYLALKDIKYKYDIAGCGIVARIEGESKSSPKTEKGNILSTKTIALRADMDALKIQEQNNVPYCSLYKGVMHACGHDAHVAMLLGAAFILNDLKTKFCGTIKLIFQPGEEKLPGGASRMIMEKVIDDVDLIIAQHVYPDLPYGEVGFHAGPYMASSDEVNITIKGRGGHAAKPAERDNTMLAMAKIITKLSELYPENDISNGLLVFGRLVADGTYNVIPSKVKLKGTMRTFDENKRKSLKDNILKVSKEIAIEYGCDAEVFIEQGYPSLKNDVNLTKKCMTIAKEFLGENNVKNLPQLMTAEDFAWYSQKIPACFYRLGTSNVSLCIDSKQHTSTFDIDEESMKIGMGLMTYLAINNL